MATGNSDSDMHVFLWACKKGDLDKVNMLLESGVNPNSVIEHAYGFGNHSINPLLTACTEGHFNVVETLLKSGANPNVIIEIHVSHKNFYFDDHFSTITPLLAACKKGCLNIVEALLEAKADPNGVNKKCIFPLIVAAYTDRADITRCLIMAGADPNKRSIAKLSSRSEKYIMKPTSCDAVEILLKGKADPNTVKTWGRCYLTPLLIAISFMYTCVWDETYEYHYINAKGKTALHFASNKDVVKALLEANVDPNVPDDNGMTPLLRACLAITDKVTAVGVIKLLLQYGADLNSKIQCDEKQGKVELYGAGDAYRSVPVVEMLEINNATHGEVALHIAIVRGFSEAVEVLLTEGKISPDITFENGKTPLIIACDSHVAQVVLALIKCRANPNLADNDGTTPLIVACYRFSDNAIIFALLKAGADLTKSSKYGITPLIGACVLGCANIVTILLEAGADFTVAEEKHGRTPLIIASEHGHCEVMSLLLKAGADFEKGDNNGNTPLIQACRRNEQQAVSMLLNAGADPNKADHDGTTPLIAALSSIYGRNNN